MDEIIWHGQVHDRKFVAFYVNNDQVLAAAGCEYDHGMATPAQLRSGKTDLLTHLK